MEKFKLVRRAQCPLCGADQTTEAADPLSNRINHLKQKLALQADYARGSATSYSYTEIAIELAALMTIQHLQSEAEDEPDESQS